MQAILLILAASIGLTAYYLYPRFPVTMRLVTGCLLLSCLGSLSILVFGPSNLMERLPQNLAYFAHPWVLGSSVVATGLLFFSCAVGSFTGCVNHRRLK